MTNTFKKGDRVQRQALHRDDAWWKNFCSVHQLPLNCVLTVYKSGKYTLDFVGCDRAGDPDSFELVSHITIEELFNDEE